MPKRLVKPNCQTAYSALSLDNFFNRLGFKPGFLKNSGPSPVRPFHSICTILVQIYFRTISGPSLALNPWSPINMAA